MLLIGFAICSPVISSLAFAEESRERSLELFEKHVRPTLVEHCVRCHGPKKQKGGLRLDIREGWEEGGDSGPAVVAGDPESLLLQVIRYDDLSLEMPPKGKLPDATIAAFEQWVVSGAADPRESSMDSSDLPTSDAVKPPTLEEGREFWAFQPVVQPALPDTGESWAVKDLDRFVFARLQEHGLTPNPDAERIVLLRRLYFDLIGLPPTTEQVDAFLNDPSENAYEDLVDRLLSSQHFGERWGRHWLDVVRFAESSGGGRTLLFPNAWRYRDYVIDSFFQDVPYDQFLRQQIAGDLLPTDDWEQKARNLTATAFLLLGPINYEMQDKDILEMDIVDEQLDTIGKAMMGMTIGCARCHDHKFDPIPAADYYAMAGIFKSTQSVIHSNVSKWNMMDLPLAPSEAENFEEQSTKLARLEGELKSAKQAFAEVGGSLDGSSIQSKSLPADRLDGIVMDDVDAERIGDWVQSTSIGVFVGRHYIHDAEQGRGAKRVIYRPVIDAAGRYRVFVSYTASNNRATNTQVQVRHVDGQESVRVNQRNRPSIDGLLEPIGEFQFEQGPAEIVISNDGASGGVVIADAIVLLPVTDAEETDGQASSLVRSESDASDEAQASKVLRDRLRSEIKELETKIKGLKKRLPKRAAVMATKDAASPKDIHIAIRGQTHQLGDLVPRGMMQVASWDSLPPIPTAESGRRQFAEWISSPQHPLTSRVMANRVWYWLMGRGIVSSVDNFGSMGQSPTHPLLLDHLASKFVERGWSIKALIREIVLSRTYRMTSAATPESVAVDPENQLFWRSDRKRLRAEDIRDSLLFVSGDLDTRYGGSNIRPGTKIEYGYRFTSKRRSVYMPVFRNTLPEIFEVFDFADPNTQAGSRGASAVASQALWMMNHPMMMEQSEKAATRLLGQSLVSDEDRVRHAYMQVVSRPPTERELDVAISLVTSSSDGSTDISSDVAVSRYAMLYRVLFQCLDFRYLN
ncbi:MAG: DUF1553 domain-containing protein [Planctomycetota bacterium]